jgi:hypothetical protein
MEVRPLGHFVSPPHARYLNSDAEVVICDPQIQVFVAKHFQGALTFADIGLVRIEQGGVVVEEDVDQFRREDEPTAFSEGWRWECL